MRFIKVFLALVFGVVLQVGTAMAASNTINLAYNPSTGNILGFIAIDKGFAKEEGFDINLVPFSNSTDA